MMTIRCVLVALLATAAVAAPDVLKDGSCPPNDVIGICVVPDNACIGDGQCPGDEKCCSFGCNRVCLPPVKDEGCEELECLEEARETCPNGVVTVFGCPTCQCQDEAPFCTRALCPVGTRCDDTLQACVPLEACPPVCAIFCEFGKVLDANGCETCECNPDPCWVVKCGSGTQCVVIRVDLVCITTPCNTPQFHAECVDSTPKPGDCPVLLSRRPCTDPNAVDECTLDAQCRGTYKCCDDGVCGVLRCQPPVVQCPQVRCSSECPAGYIHDKDGCQTCECENVCALIDCAPGYTCDPDVGECVPEECEPELCKVRCEFGFALDENGCEFCQCRIDPCATVRCGFGTVCVARRVDVLCIHAPCPPQFEVSCVDPASKPGSCPTVFSLRPCTEPNAVAECMYDTECRGDYKCCDDGICGVMRCTAPQVSCRPLRCPACRAGHVMVDGCPTCKCINPCAAIGCAPGYTCDENTGRCEQVGPRCLPVRCDATCQLTLDENDCEICSCSRDPCATQICRRNYHCEVTRGDQTRCVRDLVLRRRTGG